MKPLLIAFSQLILVSCVATVDMNTDGSVKVIGPLMARADRLAVNAKTQVGELRVMIVNGNSESVPNTFIGTAGTAFGVGVAGSVQKSNNALTATQNTNAANQAIKINQSNNALKATQTKSVPVITTPPQQVTFPP